MKISVLGTGMVGQAIGSKLVSLGHQVMMGSRSATNEKAAEWARRNGDMACHDTFAGAAAFGDIIFNCLKGDATLPVFSSIGSQLLGKTVIDISNPLDFSKGMPPTLSIVNDNSLGEELQRMLPGSHVIKTLNTLNCQLMVNPGMVNSGDHHIFLSGNHEGAKAQVRELLRSFGWKEESIIDLGDISTARGTEQLLPLWIRLMGALGTTQFQFKIVR